MKVSLSKMVVTMVQNWTN